MTFTASTGASISGYTVTAIDLTDPAGSGRTAQGAGSPITFGGLTPCHSYRFTVTATNAAGATGPASAPSAAVTLPKAPPSGW